MKKTLLTLIAVSVLAIGAVAPASAQGRGQGGGQQGGGGQGRGQGGGFGGQRGGMMGGGASVAQLVGRADVQKDIKLTDEQKTKIEKINADAQAQRQAMFEEMRNGGGGGDRQAMMSQFQKMQEDIDKKVEAVLTAEQKTRITQIKVQLQGARALMDNKIQNELKLSVDQKKKIEDLRAKQQQAMQEVMRRVQDQEIQREDVGPLMEKNNKIMDEELMKVLNDDQKKVFADMKGPEFKADPNQGRRGGGGN
ncbi:MAG: hypothetical protein KDC26_09295 [Armatimonadetes bacterium]|nr:hypothetical protein [Armatimonadota bacterium]